MVLDEESRKPSHTEDMIQFVCVHVYVCFTQMCYKHQKKNKRNYIRVIMLISEGNTAYVYHVHIMFKLRKACLTKK